MKHWKLKLPSRRSPSSTLPVPTGGKSQASRSREAKPSAFEIQFHPADIRRRVRYLFLSRRQAVGVALAVLAVMIGFALSLRAMPEAVRALLGRRELPALEAERERQGGRLGVLVERLGELQERGEDLRFKVDKISLAYGLSHDESIGQGGFPVAPEATPIPKSNFSNAIRNGQVLRAEIEEELQVLDAFLVEIRDLEEAHQERARITPSVIPLRGENFLLTSPYGNRRSPFTQALDFHAGIDLAAPIGKEIHAPAEAVVAFAGRYPRRQSVSWWRYGNLVVLRHGDRFISLYGHCDEVRVRRGQRVRQGDVIGTVGNTGWSTSPHLHYEVRSRQEDGTFRPIDPRIYILDYRWSDEERTLIRSRNAPALDDFEPLPALLGS
ncbi:MAG: M23 family metallopeptidase [Acidobacteriota bacterium]